jgi:hypothetical protein
MESNAGSSDTQQTAKGNPQSQATLVEPGLKPKKPWRFDTNERYREVIRSLMTLSTATLLLPVFFAREFLAVDKIVPLKKVFGGLIYSSWIALGVGILSGVFFHYVSGKWMAFAWGREDVEIWKWKTTEDEIEAMLNWSFWISFLGFVLGLILIVAFFLSFDQKDLLAPVAGPEQKK